jgi:hypothetical protein
MANGAAIGHNSRDGNEKSLFVPVFDGNEPVRQWLGRLRAV